MNKKHFIILITLLLLITGCWPQNVFNQKDFTIKQSVEEFSSDKYKGRLAGTEENNNVAKLIESIFKELGIEPYDGINYLYEYKQPVFDEKKQVHVMNVKFKDGNKKELLYGIDYLENNPVNDIMLNCPITFDINDPFLKEKAVVLEDRKNIAKVYGVAKLVLIKKNNFTKNVRTKETIPLIQISKKAYDLLKSNPDAELLYESKLQQEIKTVYNVVGKIGGSNKNNALVLSAHFDHVGTTGNNIYPGAADNSTGLAVLLDLSKKLKEYTDKNKLDFDIVFCAFNGEEYGRFGSKSFVQLLKKDYKNIYNINIDSIGIKNGGVIAVAGDKNVSGPLMQILNEYLSENNFKSKMSVEYESDHLSFSEENIKSVNIGQENVEVLHTTKDTIDKIDFKYLENLSDVVYQFIIKEGTKIFGIKDDTKDMSLSEEEKKIDDIIEKERENLNFGQYKLTEIDGKKYLVKKFDKEFSDIKSFQEIYGKTDLPINIGEYELASIYVHDITVPEIDINKMEIGKIYNYNTENFSKNNIQVVNLSYYKKDANNKKEKLHISIYKKIDHGEINGSDSILPEEYVEEVLYNGVRYTIHHIKNSKEISSISTVVKKDNEEYYVDIIKGFVQEVEFEGKKVEGMRYNWFSKDKSLKFVENINPRLLVDKIFWQK